MIKTCLRCDQDKPEESFHRDRKRRKGICAECVSADRRARGVRRRSSETPDARLTRLLWEEYRLTREQYEAMVNAQGSTCAICRKPPAAGRRLAVDHCHATGVVRALLCTACNVAVGVYENHHKAAAAYLAVYGAGNPLLKNTH